MGLPFTGQTAVITGASGGIGAACVRALAATGADIAACDVRFSEYGSSALNDAKALGRRVFTSTFDICDANACEKFVTDVDRELGNVQLHVAAAVYSDREPFTEADLLGFRKTIDISMWGSYFMLRSVANVMIRRRLRGSMVIVSSPHAVVPFPNCMAYNMAKAAQDSMAKTAATELLKHKIRVNILHPGWTDTPGERKFYSEEDLAKAAQTLPMGRLARPEEMARGVAFLLDPASESINGVTLTMDGGLSLPWWSKRGEGAL